MGEGIRTAMELMDLGQFFSEILSALPKLASTPLGVIGLVVVLGAYLFAFYRKARFDSLISKIKSLPEADRKDMLSREMETGPIPESISALQWMSARKQRYFFLSYLLTATYVFILLVFLTRSDLLTGQTSNSNTSVIGDGNVIATDGSTIRIGPDATDSETDDVPSN